MIERTASAKPPASPPARSGGNPGIRGDAAERFRHALSSAAHQTARRPEADDDLLKDREDRAPQAGMPGPLPLPDTRGGNADHAQRPAENAMNEGAAVPAYPQQGAMRTDLPPTAGRSEGAVSGDAQTALLERFGAALDAPLASLKPGENSAFTLSLGSAHMSLSAQVQRGADGRLAVALALPGAAQLHRDSLARDLRRHLAGKGFPDTVVRVAETLGSGD